MRTIRTALVAGVGALMLSGALSVASAGPATHVMTVRLPGGAVEQIRYSGDVPPQVVVTPDAMPVDFGWPVAFFGPDSPFAEMNRISAEMDHQLAAVMRNVDALAANPGLTEIQAGQLPPGSESYSFVSTMSGNGTCARSVQITSRGKGQKPEVVSKTYGDCGSGGGAIPGVQRALPSDQPSDVREIRYVPRTNNGMIREASAVQY